MNRLAIETSTECCSVALQMGGAILERHRVEPRAHARLVLPWASELLAEGGIGFGDLDGLAVSRGPGGFTSLRIGLGIVQGLALAHDLPVYPVSSLDVLAQSADPDASATALLTLFDARMGEVYAAWYQVRDGQRVRLGEEQLLPPDQLKAPQAATWLATGPGARTFEQAVDRALGSSNVRFQHLDANTEDSWPRASALLALADRVDPLPGHRIVPVYLRDQVTG
jgi:tRNA threonylcarbamoyladenosine biosynthesis protein TsaB